MTTLVLNETTAKTPLGVMLASATDRLIEIRDESGELVAKILMTQESPAASNGPMIAAAESRIDELRRRSQSDRSSDVTTQQLLKLANSQTPEQGRG